MKSSQRPRPWCSASVRYAAESVGLPRCHKTALTRTTHTLAGINGAGRIGRLVFRAATANADAKASEGK